MGDFKCDGCTLTAELLERLMSHMEREMKATCGLVEDYSSTVRPERHVIERLGDSCRAF